jgi:hypothetical protein
VTRLTAAGATVAVALAAVVGAGGCKPPLTAQKARVSLRMHGSPADAVVLIDDQAVGTLDLIQARGVAVPVGVHHVTVKAQGYFPWDREVEAVEGSGPVRLEVALVPVPD